MCARARLSLFQQPWGRPAVPAAAAVWRSGYRHMVPLGRWRTTSAILETEADHKTARSLASLSLSLDVSPSRKHYSIEEMLIRQLTDTLKSWVTATLVLDLRWHCFIWHNWDISFFLVSNKSWTFIAVVPNLAPSRALFSLPESVTCFMDISFHIQSVTATVQINCVLTAGTSYSQSYIPYSQSASALLAPSSF